MIGLLLNIDDTELSIPKEKNKDGINTYAAKADLAEMMGSEVLVYLNFLNTRVISRFAPSTSVVSGDIVYFQIDAS